MNMNNNGFNKKILTQRCNIEQQQTLFSLPHLYTPQCKQLLPGRRDAFLNHNIGMALVKDIIIIYRPDHQVRSPDAVNSQHNSDWIKMIINRWITWSCDQNWANRRVRTGLDCQVPDTWLQINTDFSLCAGCVNGQKLARIFKWPIKM